MNLQKALRQSENIHGLRLLKVLSEQEKELVLQHEEERNTGVMECLKRKHVLLVAHDETFRAPPSAIVLDDVDEIEFPAVLFPEIEQAMSASPSAKVHEMLTRSIQIDEEEATLLIGFDE